MKMDLPYSRNAGLYIHIPFCVRKCPYCDFYSLTDVSLKPKFLKALLREMELVSAEGLCFDTLYMGGGTPSNYESDKIAQIVAAGFQNLNLRPDSEITVEVNPGTVSLEQLRAYRDFGINRINIGVQSFDQRNLDFLERIHTSNEARNAISDTIQAGFKKIGLDLIYGLPDQSNKDWLKILKQAVEYHPSHLSCYMLTYEKGTPLHRDLKSGRVLPLPDEKLRALFESTIDFLEDHGYFQYEISNFARAGEDSQPLVSKHNLKYWTQMPYIGLGPSAHSFIEPQRYWNVSNIDSYIETTESGRLPIAEKEVLTQEQEMIEAIYLGLRMRQGIDTVWFQQRFGINFVEAFEGVIADLKKRSHVKVDSTHIALTRQGMALLDSIASLFVEKDLRTACDRS